MVAAEAEKLARDAEANAVVTKYTCSTGVVLNIRPVPPRVRSDALAQVAKPQVPKVFIKDLGREEENPDDPAYAQALLEWQEETFRRGFQVSLVLGTSVNSVPEGMYPPESDGWIDDLEAAAEAAGSEMKPIRRTPEKARYCDWLMYYALGNDEDHTILTTLLYSVSLVTEAALARAIDSFRSITQRPADLARGDQAPGQERDRDGVAAAGGSA